MLDPYVTLDDSNLRISMVSFSRRVFFGNTFYKLLTLTYLMSIIIAIIVGAIAGWLAGLIMKGSGFGILGNIIVGIIGGLIGGILDSFLPLFDGSDGFLGAIFLSTVGAIVLLFIINLFKKGANKA